ncbi:MAG TPA: VWA domain-containing protein [Thermoanaerobaculia bacterium]
MSFRDVTLLWLVALVPFACAFLVMRERTRTRLARRLVSERLRGVSLPARALRPWLLGIALLGATLALAGPYAGYTLVPIVAREANRVILIDVSNSMAAEDVGTSRLSAAKAIAKRLADAQQGRVALVVFEGAPDVVSPLTSDTDAVAALIDTLQPGEVGQPGSDLGSAILGAMQLVESDPSQKADLVLISDGEEQGARVTEAVQRAKSRAIPVSTILLGTSQGATIPTGRGPLRDASGDVVTTYARAGTLREIASGTGGTMLENPFAEHALDPLLGTARATARQTHARVPVERFQWPLGLAVMAIFAASFVNRGAE